MLNLDMARSTRLILPSPKAKTVVPVLISTMIVLCTITVQAITPMHKSLRRIAYPFRWQVHAFEYRFRTNLVGSSFEKRICTHFFSFYIINCVSYSYNNNTLNIAGCREKD